MVSEMTSKLIEAIRAGELANVKRALENGASPHSKDEYGEGPLINASRGESLDVVKLLINAGARLDTKGERGWTALRWSIDKRREEIALFLIQSGADVNSIDRNRETPLYWSVFQGLDAVTKRLVSAGADVNIVTKANATCLRTAVSRPENMAIVELLVENGARLDQSPFDLFFAAVSTAVNYGDLSPLQYLLKLGLECYGEFPNGRNVIDFIKKHMSDKKGFHAAIEILTKHHT